MIPPPPFGRVHASSAGDRAENRARARPHSLQVARPDAVAATAPRDVTRSCPACASCSGPHVCRGDRCARARQGQRVPWKETPSVDPTRLVIASCFCRRPSAIWRRIPVAASSSSRPSRTLSAGAATSTLSTAIEGAPRPVRCEWINRDAVDGPNAAAAPTRRCIEASDAIPAVIVGWGGGRESPQLAMKARRRSASGRERARERAGESCFKLLLAAVGGGRYVSQPEGAAGNGLWSSVRLCALVSVSHLARSRTRSATPPPLVSHAPRVARARCLHHGAACWAGLLRVHVSAMQRCSICSLKRAAHLSPHIN